MNSIQLPGQHLLARVAQSPTVTLPDYLTYVEVRTGEALETILAQGHNLKPAELAAHVSCQEAQLRPRVRQHIAQIIRGDVMNSGHPKSVGDIIKRRLARLMYDRLVSHGERANKARGAVAKKFGITIGTVKKKWRI